MKEKDLPRDHGNFLETFILTNVNFAGKFKILAMSFENLVVRLKYFPQKKNLPSQHKDHLAGFIGPAAFVTHLSSVY